MGLGGGVDGAFSLVVGRRGVLPARSAAYVPLKSSSSSLTW